MVQSLDYYKENYEKIFNAIENPQWRIWKIIDADGSCRQNRVLITTSFKLLKFIRSCKNPSSLYVSTSTFLNPHRNHGFFANQKETDKHGHYFYPREGYITADCILLDSYFFIDLDSEEDLRIAQDDGRKIIKALKKNVKLSLHSIQFSGKKGIHLIYKFRKRQIKDPKERVLYYRRQKAEIVKSLLSLKLKTLNPMHVKIVEDVFRVYAAPYSIKSNGGTVQPLDKKAFMEKDIYKLERPAREPKGNDKKVAPVKAVHPSPSTVSDGSSEAGLSSSITSFKFVDNMVNGLRNNYITILKKHKSRFKPKLLRRLQKTYQLSDFYIERIGDYIYAYNTKIQQFKRNIKIMKAYKSENLRWFLSRKHLPLQLSYTQEREFMGIMHSEYGQADNHSMAHSRFLRLKYVNEVGKPSRVGIMRIEEKG